MARFLLQARSLPVLLQLERREHQFRISWKQISQRRPAALLVLEELRRVGVYGAAQVDYERPLRGGSSIWPVRWTSVSIYVLSETIH